MAERINGNISFSKRGKSHGSYRRGVNSTASRMDLTSLAQSYRDKQELQERMLRLQQERLSASERIDLGNKELRAYEVKNEFLAAVESNKVSAFIGETGTGKSTQGLQFLLEADYDLVVGLVPRKVIADNLGERVRHELSEHFGEEAERMVGIVHGERSERSEESRILVMTPNTFVRMEKDIYQKYGDKKVVIFGDEIHEAGVHTEIAVGSAAMAVQEHPNWRLVLASATMNQDTVQGAFQELNDGKYVPVIEIEGRPHDVEVREHPDLTASQAYAEYGRDHQKTMIFTKGEAQVEYIIKTTREELERREKGSSKDVVFRMLHAGLSKYMRASVDDPIPEGSRLVIVCTNAGMSGVTYPGTTLVISDGVVNRPERDAYGVDGLVARYASQAELTQMFGRAGRDVDGGLGMLVKPTTIIEDSLKERGIELAEPEMEYKPFKDRDPHGPAEIYNTNLSRVALSVSGGVERDFHDLNRFLMHKVEKSDIIQAQRSLSRKGALSDDYRITKTGHVMDSFPLIPELSRGLAESISKNRPMIHMARAALIASAIDAGGLQDFRKNESKAWSKLIRHTSDDDFMAQLDIMTELYDTDRPMEFAYRYDLQAHRVERAMDASRKVLKILNIYPDSLVLGTPKPDEEDALREDFTAGMIDLVYERSSRRRNVQLYRNILGVEGSIQRNVSDRSVSNELGSEYLAAFPRWYIKQTRHGKRLTQVIDKTLIVKPETVAKYAEQIPSSLTGEPVEPTLEGGRVVEKIQRKFGSIAIGKPETATTDIIPDSSRELLKQKALTRPGRAIEALKEISEELAWFENAIPPQELVELKNINAPEPITPAYIEELVWEKTAQTRDLHVLDELLIDHIYSKGISIVKYYDEEVLAELRKRSPKFVSIGRSIVQVHYDNGQPYITKKSAIQRQSPLKDFYLPDGREILIQRDRPASLGGTERVSARDYLPSET